MFLLKKTKKGDRERNTRRGTKKLRQNRPDDREGDKKWGKGREKEGRTLRKRRENIAMEGKKR